MSDPARSIVDAALYALGGHTGPFQLHEPLFEGNEWEYVKNCIDTGWVSSVGAYVDRLEADLVRYTGAKRAIAVVNGTAALHLALVLAGVRAGDEVIVPSFSFIATANAVSYCGASPHFADIDASTLGLDPGKLRDHLRTSTRDENRVLINRSTGRPIRAIVVMHTFGHPADLDALQEISREFHLPLIEDAAESLGSWYKGRHTGTMGEVGIISFNGNKVVTTGGGGVVLTQSDTLGLEGKDLSTTARVKHEWSVEHSRLAFNYRLPNLNAALGCAQLERLPQFLEWKRTLAHRYVESFQDIPGVAVIREPAGTHSNYWLNAILLDASLLGDRERIIAQLHQAGIMSRFAWTPLHRHSFYVDCPRMDLTVTNDLAPRILNLPSSAKLGRPNV